MWFFVRTHTHTLRGKCKERKRIPNSPGNSCCASKTKRSVHQRSCDDAVDPGGEAVLDVEFCESSMTLFDLLFDVIFEFQSDCGGELGR